MRLLPCPVRLTPLEGALPPGVLFDAEMPECWRSGPLPARLAEVAGRIAEASPRCAPARLPLRLLPDAAIADQGFRLRLTPEGGLLLASSPDGVWHGLLTLEQLVTGAPDGVASCEVEDAPSFAVRGVMLDISRCKVPTMETLRFLVDRLARLRVNQIQLYTEHTFAYAGHETVWREGSPMTPAEIRELDAFCAERFIELVPNQNSFGHFERWLRHPEYRHLAETPGGCVSPWGTVYPHGSVLRPDGDSLRLLSGLYDQLLPCFRSRVLNVGCDETWELGEGWSRDLCARRGRPRVYLDFLLSIHRLVRERGCSMQFWGDIILKQPELIRELPAGVTALDWGYEHDHPFAEECARFRESGVPFLVCPGTSSWNSLTGKTSNALDNLRSAARHGHAAGAEGMLVTDWGDNGHHQTLPVSFVPFAAGACLAWRADGLSDDEAEAAAGVFFDADGAPAARLFASLGRVPDVISERFYNSTAFHHLLFHPPEPSARLAERLARVAPAELDIAEGLLTCLADEARGLADAQVRDEFLLGIRMALAGLARRRALLRDNAAPEGFAGVMAGLAEEHQRLWLRRNRPGGLEESLGHLLRLSRTD